MKRQLKLTRILAAATLLIIAMLAHSDEPELGGTFEIAWSTIDCGGGTSANASFVLDGTIGQPDAGPAMSNASFELAGGFWTGGVPVNTCPADIAPPTGNDIVNVDDLLAVINSWGPCPGCPADIAPPPNGDDQVNVDDLLLVINGWGLCPTP